MSFKDSNRYNASSNEGYEPGSNDEVLKNYLGITSKEIMDQTEAKELQRAELEIITEYDESHQFSVKDICEMHRVWLAGIYPFAGKYRTVNISKDGFPFAGASYIPKCMEKFEQDCLVKYTPCKYIEISDIAHAIGVVHVEFILIHPFREGNGRIGRLLSLLMCLQAKRPPLSFLEINQTKNPEGFKKYIQAIHAGVSGNYVPIQEIFKGMLENSNR